MKQCRQCSQEFCTYIPGTDCMMPDGASVFYSDPQEDCPNCDPNNWGAAWNKDEHNNELVYLKMSNCNYL